MVKAHYACHVLKHVTIVINVFLFLLSDGDDILALSILVELLAPKNAKETIKFVYTEYQVWFYE